MGWVRFTMDADDGAGGRVLTLYESVDGTTWTQVATRTRPGVMAIHPGTDALQIGQWGASGSPAAGVFAYAEVRNGIGGPVVASWDGRAPAPRYRDPQGNIWTVNGTANAWQVLA